MFQQIRTGCARATLLLAVFAQMLSGCAGNRESKIVGQWKVHASAIEAKQSKNPAEQMRIDMAKKMLENITLDINQDKTFVMNMMVTEAAGKMETGGEWKLDESANTLTLTMAKANGPNIPNAARAAQIASKPLTLNISADNKILSMAQSGGAEPGGAGASSAQDAMTFVKAK